jgi:Ca2+-transporting ATPase
MSAAVLAAMAISILWLEFDAVEAVTVSFLTLAFTQLWHVFNMRDEPRRILSNEITANPWIWAAIGLCIGLIVAAVYVPGLSSVLSLSHPGLAGWGVVLVTSMLPLLLAAPIAKWL